MSAIVDVVEGDYFEIQVFGAAGFSLGATNLQ